MYAGGVTIARPGITLQSAPGHWAVLASPINKPTVQVTLTIRPGASSGVLRRALRKMVYECAHDPTLNLAAAA